MKTLDQVKAEFPQCHQIISLLEHLHHDCTRPEEAAYHTLRWLSACIRQTHKNQTAIVLQGIAGSGKSTLINQIIQPIFGAEKCKVITQNDISQSINEDKNVFGSRFISPSDEKIFIIDNFVPEYQADEWHKYIYTLKSYHKGHEPTMVQNYLFATHCEIHKPVHDRHLLIAKCKQSYQHINELQDEIQNGALFAFADLLREVPLHGINNIRQSIY